MNGSEMVPFVVSCHYGPRDLVIKRAFVVMANDMGDAEVLAKYRCLEQGEGQFRVIDVKRDRRKGKS
jgi:hypothetical protein